MELSSLLGIGAATWGVAMSLAPILQIRAIRAQGDSNSVSTGQWAVWCIGFSLWLSYGVSVGDVPLMVNNVAALTMGITTLAVVIRYKSPEHPKDPVRA